MPEVRVARKLSTFELIPASAMESDLSPHELAVLCHLTRFHSEDRGCFPKQNTVAQKANMSLRKVNECVATLREKGFLSTHKETPEGPLVYTLLDPPYAGGAQPYAGGAQGVRTQCVGGTHEVRNNKEYSSKEDSSNTSLSELPPSEHLRRLNKLAEFMSCPRWDKLTPARKTLLKKRRAEEGCSDWEDFYQAVHRVTRKVHPTWWALPWWNLEVFLRIPQRGNPDHFQRASEGAYNAPADGSGKPVAPPKPIRTESSRNLTEQEAYEAALSTFGPEAAERLVNRVAGRTKPPGPVNGQGG